MGRVQTNPNSPRALRKAATGDRIRTVARQLFDTAGYEATGIRDIAAAAGLTTGAIFGHYPGKAAVYEELYGHPPITAEQGRALLLAAESALNLLRAGYLSFEDVGDLSQVVDLVRGRPAAPQAEAA